MATQKPDLTRVWANGAPPANVVDPDTTTPGKVNAGWQAEVPPFEHFNFLQKWFTQGLAHFNEQGIGVWDTDTTYPADGLVKGSDGEIYISKVEQSGNNPISDSGVNWQIISNELTISSVNGFEGIKLKNFVRMVGFYEGSNALLDGGYGGGLFIYKSDISKSEHNGGTIISPTVPRLSSQISLVDWLDGNGETDPTGNGVYVRVEALKNESDSTWYGLSPFNSNADDNAVAIQRAWDNLDTTVAGEGFGAVFTMCPDGTTDIGDNTITFTGVAAKVICNGQLVGNTNAPLIHFDVVQQIDLYSPRFRNENFGTSARTLKLSECYTFNVFGGRLLMNKFLNAQGYTLEMQGNAINFYGTAIRYGRRNLLILDGANRVANNFFGCSLDRCGEGQVEINQTSSTSSTTYFHGGYLEMSSDVDGDTTALVLINNRPKVVFEGVYMSVRASNRFFEINGTATNPDNIIVSNCELNNIGTGAQAFLLRNGTGLNTPLMTIDNYSTRAISNPITISNNAFILGNSTDRLLVGNPDFKFDLSSWVSTGNTSQGDSENVGDLSLGYLETSADSANSYQIFRTIPGQRYRVTCWGESAGGGASAQLSIREVDLSTVIGLSSNSLTEPSELEVCFTPTVDRVAVVLRQVGSGSSRLSQVKFEKLL